MRKQNLLFSESYIMDNTTVAPLCRAQRRSRGGGGGEEKEKGGRPSIFDKEPLLWTGTAARLKHSLKWLSPPPPSFLSLSLVALRSVCGWMGSYCKLCDYSDGPGFCGLPLLNDFFSAAGKNQTLSAVKEKAWVRSERINVGGEM